MHDLLTQLLILLFMCPAFVWMFPLSALSACCCTPSCTFFTDDFNRSDDDDPGAYTEVSGDWDISSNKLVTSDSSAVLIADAEHPDGEPNIKVSVTVNISTSGDTARIILDYVDSNNYWFAEVKAGTGAYLRIYERSGGTNTQRAGSSLTVPTGNILFCAAIVNANVITASLNTSSSAKASFAGSFSSAKSGLGTGTLTGTVSLSALSLKRTADGCPPCANCGDCINDLIPAQFKVVISGIANDSCTSCAAYNGTFYVALDTLTPGPTPCARYNYTIPSGFCVGPSPFGTNDRVQVLIRGIYGTTRRILVYAGRDNTAEVVGLAFGLFSDPASNCMSFLDQPLTNISIGSSPCNVASAAALLTSL